MKKFHLREENVYDFSYNTIADNLFVIFGTHKIIRVLSPSLRALPMTGIEFSFQQREAGYDENGVIWNDYDDEVPIPSQEIQMSVMTTAQTSESSQQS